jgi:hypothetical protein
MEPAGSVISDPEFYNFSAIKTHLPCANPNVDLCYRTQDMIFKVSHQ